MSLEFRPRAPNPPATRLDSPPFAFLGRSIPSVHRSCRSHFGAIRLAALALVAVAAPLVSAGAPAAALPPPVVLHANGGWCWFQDERAIILNERLYFGSLAGGNRGGFAAGDVVVTSLDLRSRQTASFTLHPRFQCDDHDVPALLALPDGRLLATYQSHGQSQGLVGPDLMRWRRTLRPHDISAWTDERTLPVGASVSYSNLFRLPAEGGRILNFHRGLGFNPNYLISTDDGATFSYGGRLLFWPRRPEGDPRFTGISGGRPYLKYAQHGPGTIHFVATEDHPSSYDNSLYHAFLRAGELHHSDGRPLGPLSRTSETTIRPTDLTCIFRGDVDHVAWMCDLQVDRDGRPRVVFSVQRGGAAGRGKRNNPADGMDLRYHYARWDGAAWQVNEIAHAGSRLYAGEDDYAGLAAIDPQAPDTVFISTNADPVAGTPLISAADGRRHWEIFRGESADHGRTFRWHAVTRDSPADNLRPIVPIWPEAAGRRLVLWLRGTYRKYTDYDLEVVALLPDR
ncbi:MAG: hypothetical protein FJ399_07090 [Verrucomicrobia bacterium]|nr:hypothetical protein [Verrucomicrobiota bacterium]